MYIIGVDWSSRSQSSFFAQNGLRAVLGNQRFSPVSNSIPLTLPKRFGQKGCRLGKNNWNFFCLVDPNGTMCLHDSLVRRAKIAGETVVRAQESSSRTLRLHEFSFGKPFMKQK